MAEKEDFDHENRIYTLEGAIKVFKEDFFEWKEEIEGKYNDMSELYIQLNEENANRIKEIQNLKKVKE